VSMQRDKRLCTHAVHCATLASYKTVVLGVRGTKRLAPSRRGKPVPND
jgi:glycine cleavage system pyridoxal-binding protein P